MNRSHPTQTKKARRTRAPKGAARTVHIDPATYRDNSIRVDKSGTVTLSPEAQQVVDEKIAENLNKSGLWLAVKLSNTSFGQSVRNMVTAYEADQCGALLDGFAGVTNAVIAKAANGNPAQLGPLTGTPQYADLDTAAESASVTVTNFPIETHNAHADPAQLNKAGQDLTHLGDLNGILTDGVDQVSRTLAPLARETASTVSDVCLSVEEEVERNPPLKRSLEPALDYINARSAKGQQTKKKIAKAKAGKGPGTGAPGSGDTTGGGAGGGTTGGGATGGKANLT